MKKRDVLYSNEARQHLVTGVNMLADAVKVTLGPGGRNVIISRPALDPLITKDGVTVARNMYTDDERLNTAMKIIRNVASRTEEVAGDGTTTATVLAQAQLNKGIQAIESGINAVEFKKGMEIALKEAIEYIDSVKIPVEDKLEDIAKISANGDEELAKVISDTYSRVGVDGTVLLKEGETTKTFVEFTEGIEFNRGFISPYFATELATQTTTLHDPFIILYHGVLESYGQIKSIVEAIISQNRSFLIIAEDVLGEALNVLVTNVVQGRISCAAVKGPSFGDLRLDMMEDLAAVVGGTVIDKSKGLSLETAKAEYLGTAETVVVGREFTRIVNGGGEQKEVLERIALLEARAEAEKDQTEAGDLRRRVSKLKSGAATIYLGAYTDVELREKKDRLEDTLSAVKAALMDGIVPGGGNTLYVTSTKMVQTFESPAIQAGYDAVVHSMAAPMFTIANNAGITIGTDNENSIFFNNGLDARKGTYVNLIENGIVDPAMVTKTALSNAVSVTALLLTTECMLVDMQTNHDLVPIDSL